MSNHTSTPSQSHTRNLSDEFHQLRAKLTSSPKPSSPTNAAHLSENNPTREVLFPHPRPSGLPGTTKCVGRPGRPSLSVKTDVPIVSIPRIASRYGTPWRSAAPARYGPAELTSAEMCGWLKGKREEEEEEEAGAQVLAGGDPFRIEDEDEMWAQVDVDEEGRGEEGAAPNRQERGTNGLGRSLTRYKTAGQVVEGAANRGVQNNTQDPKNGTWARRNAVARGRNLSTQRVVEAYWAQ